MEKRRFQVWWLFFGAAPLMLWLVVGFPLQALGVISEGILVSVILFLVGLAVVSCLTGSTLLIIRALSAMSRDRELERVGRLAAGVLLAVDEVGGTMSVNDQPVLKLTFEVHDGDREPYVVVKETVVPRFAALQPGFSLPLLVHPEDPRRVAVKWDSEETPMPHYGARFSDKEELEIEKRGRRGMATILSIGDSGKTRGLDVVLDVRFKVYLADEEPYEADTEIPLPPHMIERLRSLVDRSVECLVHPEEKERIKLLLG